MLIVHTKRQRQRLLEMQITALTAPPEAEKSVNALVEAYKRLLFPGQDATKKDSSFESAKRALAEETKKIYMVKKLDAIPDLRKAIKDASDAGSPQLAKAAALELKTRMEKEQRSKSRLSRK